MSRLHVQFTGANHYYTVLGTPQQIVQKLNHITYYFVNRNYNKILDFDWLCACLFVT